jgi:membrane-bound lytic murein transglycosylase A
MREVRTPRFDDELPIVSLAAAIEQQAASLANSSGDIQLKFGPRSISRVAYQQALALLAERIRSASDPAEVLSYVRANFTFFEVYGAPRWGEVFVTGYFEPVLSGSRVATPEFPQPLYAAPPDLLKLDFAAFAERFKDEPERRARVEGGRVVPYYSRAQIDSERALAGQGLELCWVNPIDAFFLQVQGSGVVQFADGSEMVLGFAEKNGHRYEAIGRTLREAMAPTKPTYPNLVQYLRELPRAEQQEIFNRNPSYVFFRKSDKNAVTAIGVPATAGRTIATDHAFFPPGALGFLDFSATHLPGETRLPSRLVLNQDVGGAIKGPGRVDLFFGRGEEAGLAAGIVQNRGRLLFLLPRTDPK